MLKLLILIATFWTIYLKAGVPNNDHQRPIERGERVIHNLTLHEVIAKSDEKNYVIKSIDQFNSTSTVEREDIAVMSGCFEDVCVKEKMFDVDYLRNVSVEAISYQGKYIAETAEGWSGYYTPDRKSLAKTTGCLELNGVKLCVGKKVRDLIGNTMTIIGLHQGGELVLVSNDGWNSYRSYVDPSSVIPH